MIATLSGSPAAPLRRLGETSDDSVRSQVWRVLSAVYPHAVRGERRGEERFPYPRLIYLRPLGPDGLTPAGDEFVVVGKHLSERGLGFYHHGPLPHRRLIATLERADDHWLRFLLDVSWCRFRRQGWYESGGRFLRPLPEPS